MYSAALARESADRAVKTADVALTILLVWSLGMSCTGVVVEEWWQRNSSWIDGEWE